MFQLLVGKDKFISETVSMLILNTLNFSVGEYIYISSTDDLSTTDIFINVSQ
jgi:hypothetical protein